MDILFLVFVTGLLLYRLWNVLGTKNGHEKKGAFFLSEDTEENVVVLDKIEKSLKNNNEEENMTLPDYQKRRLTPIFDNIKDFDADEFIENAEFAYEAIIDYFTKGDRKKLEPLLTKSVYDAFDNVLKEREKNKISYETEILEFISSDTEEAKVLENENGEKVAQITVLFKTKQVVVSFDAEGKMIENQARISVIQKDEWTFEHVCESEDPTWLLSKTRTL